MNLADDFITAIADIYSKVEARAETPEKSAFVREQKVDLALGALNNAVNPYPFAGLMDTIVLMSLARQMTEDPWSREILGQADTEAILAVLNAQEATAWQLASHYLSDDQITELRQLIAKWRSDNPQQRFVAHVRLVDFLDASAAAQSNQPRSPTSVFGLLFLDPLAGIDPAVRQLEQSRDVAERMFFYFQRVPMILSWQTEMLYRRMLSAPQLTRTIDTVSSFSEASGRMADASKQIAATVETFRKEIPEQRRETIDQLQHLVTSEREATISQATTRIASEREAVLSQATTRFSAEREATLNQVAASVRAEQQEIVHNLELAVDRSLDHSYQRMRSLVLIAIGSALAAMVLYRLLFWAIKRPNAP
ncbi:MAG TPA: hypothetical protein VH518_21570 [Tepidisphaeraceae bacterium]